MDNKIPQNYNSSNNHTTNTNYSKEKMFSEVYKESNHEQRKTIIKGGALLAGFIAFVKGISKL